MFSFIDLLLFSRMQLEEKKRAMERDKRKTEIQMEKKRQIIGKEAFLQVNFNCVFLLRLFIYLFIYNR